MSSMIGCGGKIQILNESEQVFESDGSIHDGYWQVSKGQYGKMLKCCNSCLNRIEK